MDHNERKKLIKDLKDGDFVSVNLKVVRCDPAYGGIGWTNDSRDVCVEVLDGELQPVKGWIRGIDITRIFINNPQWIDLE